MDELKKCPFCGGEAGVVQWPDTEDPNCTWVECIDCDASQGHVHHENKDTAVAEAIAAWNRRASDKALTAAEKENTRLTTIIHNRAEDREVADKLSELKKTQCCEDNCPHAGFWKD